MTFFLFLNFSPVEQFKILPILPLFKLISINNVFILILIIVSFFILSLVFLLKNFNFFNVNTSLYVIPNYLQILFEQLFKAVFGLLKNNVKSDLAQFFFPIVFALFLFLLFSNIFGLVPYSYTITSHLIVTFSLSLALFIGITIICFKKHKLKFFSLFLPSGTNIFLAFLLIPIEIISYVFKPISLAIRLFANMVAGHTLLKVIAGFSLILIMLGNFIFVLVHIVPTLILIPLFMLELAVAVIQSFVFTGLICVYINDALNLH